MQIMFYNLLPVSFLSFAQTDGISLSNYVTSNVRLYEFVLPKAKPKKCTRKKLILNISLSCQQMKVLLIFFLQFCSILFGKQ